MNANWPIVTVDEIKSDSQYSCVGGPFGSSLSRKHYVDYEGIPVIRGVNLENDKFKDSDFVFVSEKKAKELHRNLAYPGDIVFTQRGTLGQVAIIPNDSKYDKYIVSQSQMKLKVDSKKVDPYFVYLFFRSNVAKKEITNRAIIGGVPHINLGILKSLEFPYPPLTIQKSIAGVIKRYDEKIDINNQINQTLEQIAQAIFKSWFVDFDPVKAKIAAKQAGATPDQIERAAMCAISGKTEEQLAQLPPETQQHLKTTAALFPDSFVKSELGDIPEGWNVCPLSKYIDVKHGFAFKGEFFVEEATQNILLTPGNFKIGGGIKFDKIKYYKGPVPEDYILNKNDLLVTMTDLSKQADTLGFPALVPKVEGSFFLHNQRLGKVVSKKGVLNKYFLYYLFRSHRYRGEIVGSATGTTVKHTAPKKILIFQHPFHGVLEKVFDDFMASLYPKIECNMNNNTTLEELRDTLLPKLLSGEINVNNVA